MKKLILILIILVTLIYINNVDAADVCTGATLCANSYELNCETTGDGYCPEDYGDWSKCQLLNTNNRCYPCDPDCKYKNGVRDPNGESICSPFTLAITPKPVNPGSKINILTSVINPSLPNEIKIYRGL